MPSIPGFTKPPARGTLADQWQKPNAELPVELWPIDLLQSVTTQPNEWLTIEQFAQDEGGTDERGCVLVTPHQTSETLEGTDWVGRGLGSFSVQHDGGFEHGLAVTEKGVELEFFVQVRRPEGASGRIVDKSNDQDLWMTGKGYLPG